MATEFIIISNDGTDMVNGTFGSVAGGIDLSGGTVAEGDIISVSGVLFTISYEGGSDDNDVVLTLLPPPDIYVDDDWAGSTVGSGVIEDPIGGLIFGYNAFDVIDDIPNRADQSSSAMARAADSLPTRPTAEHERHPRLRRHLHGRYRLRQGPQTPS